jgi:hypothetical protein
MAVALMLFLNSIRTTAKKYQLCSQKNAIKVIGSRLIVFELFAHHRASWTEANKSSDNTNALNEMMPFSIGDVATISPQVPIFKPIKTRNCCSHM